MGDNAKIRERLETYKVILLAFNWIVAGIGIIAGMRLAGNSPGVGGGLLIAAVIGGIWGHFLINVLLSIPFILLNNGDYLATLAGKKPSIQSSDAIAPEPEKDFRLCE